MVKVISITGQAWARDADGNLRELRVGDTIQQGEVLITSDGGSAQLDFGDGLNPTLVEGDEQVVMTPELDGDEPTDASEFAALDQDIEALLAALDDDSIDLLDILDATAAGAGPGGAADGGHGFVRLARIAEDVNPLAFEYGLGLASELPEIEGGAFLAGEEEAEAPAEIEPLPPGTITVSIQDFNSQNVTQVFLVGTTTNVPAGSIVTLVITDQAGNTVTTTATVDAEGNYQTEVDLSELVDGPISVEARVVDQIGETRTAEDDAVKDTFAEATITIDTIAGDDVINGEEAQGPVTITGSVGGDAREGDTVTLTVGGETFTGTVTSDLTYVIEVPGSLLAQHDNVEANVSGSDEAGNPYSADSERPYQVVPDIVQVGPEADPAIGNVTVTEGESALFKVVLSNASPHSNTYTLELESGTATLGEDFTGDLTFSNGVTYDPSTGLITVPAGVAEFTVTVPTIDDDLVEDSETFTLTVGNVTGTGTILDNDVADGGETVTTLEDTPLSGNVLDNAESNVGELSVTGFEVEGVTYAPGQTAVLEGKGTLTLEADGSYHFEPYQDYSGPVPPVNYTVTNGLKTVNSTLDISVTPVADTPEVSVKLAQSGTVELTLGGPNVNDPQGFSVEAFKNGGAGEISIRSSGSPTGFGVAGPASDGADSEIGNGESLLVTLDTPAQSVSFQLAWLANGEYAKTTVHYTDGSSESFVISGNSAEGGFDGIGEAATRQAPEGKWIAGIEFSTPAEGEEHFSAGNDYLVHQVSYVATTTYDVEIVATPTDIDFSESIVAVVVEVPEGVTLSAGERNEDGTWTLPLESDGSYTVSVDPVTQEVTIGGLVMIVPIDYTDPVTLTVTATAQDGADTADGTASLIVPVATITIDTIAGDDVINGEEAENPVTITGTVGGDAREGDTVTLTVGGETFTGLVGEDLTYAIEVPGELLAENSQITAEVTGSDDAGNAYRADSARGYGINLSAEATITIDTITGDDVINGEEAENPVTITGSVGGDAREGDTVTIMVGGHEFTGLVGEDLSYAIEVPGELLAENSQITAEVTGSDDAGNPYSADSERPYQVVPDIVQVGPEADPAIGNVTVTEGESALFKVVLSNASPHSNTYTLELESGTATLGEDFTDALTFSNGVTLNADGTLTVPAGVTEFTVTVPTIDDALVENTEAFTLTVGGVEATGTILDNDTATVTHVGDADGDVAGVTVTEGEAAVFTVKLSNESVNDETFSLTLASGTATLGEDFTDALTFSNGVTLNADGTLTVPAGVIEFTVTVPTIDDALVENTEAFTLTVGGVEATGTILDNDTATVTHVGDADGDVAGVTVTEGEAAVFTVKLSNESVNDETFSLTLASGTATLGEDFTDALTFSNGVTLNADGTLTVPAGVTEFTVTVPTIDDALVENTEAFALTVGGVEATGTILDNDVADGSETVTTLEDTPLFGNVLSDAESNVGELSVTGFEVEGTTYQPGETAVLEGKGSLTIGADGSYHFEPYQDYSGPVPPVSYTVTNGLKTVSSTLDISVTPVADTPDVSVALSKSSPTLQAVDLSSALKPAGFMVSALKDGEPGELSIKDTGNPTGFGVAGPASDGDGSEIGNGESLLVTLDTPAQSVSFQLAWLRTSEYAKTTVHYTDGSSESFVISGNSAEGGFDGIGDVVTRQAPEGKWIAGIEFSTPAEGEEHFSGGNDYLVHQVSYEAASAYDVEIVATPADIDYSESIVAVVVEVPEGITLSAGERNEDGTWTLPLESDGSYTVSVDPETQEVTISGLVMIVPTDYTGPVTLTVTATAQDGADTADGTASLNVPVATITIDEVSGDDAINGEEAQGDVTITGSVGGDAREGDTVTLTVGGETFTGLVGEDLTYAIDVPGELLTQHDNVQASVSGSDEAGNPYSADSERSYQVVPDIVQVGPEADPATGNVTVTEGEAALFKVVLSNTSPHSNTYTLELESGTATLDEDFTGELTFSNGVTYDPSTGLITVPAGVVEFTVAVPTVDDTLVEDTETFTLTVENVTATGTILDNDTFSVSGVSQASDRDVNSNQDGSSETDIVYKGSIEGEFSPEVTLAIDGTEASGLTSNGESIGYSWDADSQTLTASTDSGVVFFVTLDASNGEYSYQQFQAIDHPDIAGADHSMDIPLTLVALDVNGNVITDSNFTITVFDDAPVVSGNLVIETENDGDFATSGYLSQATLSNDLTSVSWKTDGLPQLVFDGLPVNYVDHGDGTLTGELEDGTLIFRAQIDTSQANADNSPRYSFELLNSFGKLGAMEGVTEYTDISGGNSANYVVSFGDFLINSMMATNGEAAESTVNTNNNWIGVGGNWFNPGEKLTMAFADPDDNQGQVRGMGLSVQGQGGGSYTLHWEATGVDAAGNSVTWFGTFDGSGNKATDFTIALDGGAVYFSNLVITGVSGEFRIGLKGVVANNYNDDIPLDLAYTLTDADGDTAEGDINVTLTGPATSPDGPANPDPLPEAAGGQVEGSEDTALVLQWQDFGAAADTALDIIITQLPEAGTLEVRDAGGEWHPVAEGERFSQAGIEAGNLRFMPEANESGFDGYGGDGVGNLQADYAHIGFKPAVGDNVGEEATLRVDITPVADAPDVALTVTAGEIHGGDSAEIIKVNGGSEVAGGFDVQDGQIVRIGDGVRVWLTEGDTVPEIANPGSANAGVVAYYTQGNHGGEGQYADIFVVHSNSGWYYSQSDWNHSELRGLDSVHGNRTEDGDDALRDYIFVVQEEGFEYQVGWSTNNNANTHVNTLDGVWVGYVSQSGSGSLISQVSNNLDGVIFGDGSYATPNAPEIETVSGGEAYQEFLVDIFAQLIDTDGSEILADITLTGIPAGASVELVTAAEGVSVAPGADGSWVLTHSDQTALTDLSLVVRVPLEDAGAFSVVAHATAQEMVGSVVVDAATTLVGSNGDDILIGGAGDDILIGGLGDDVFQWSFGDQGSEGDPAKDTVKDFGTGHNVLDLADLLQGESEGNIDGFIVAEQEGDDTVLYIKHDGGIEPDGSNADQKIVLENYAMGEMTSGEFLQQLLEQNQLNIDP
jgi:uncharacterized membrane protein